MTRKSSATAELATRAYRVRRRVVAMAAHKGEGYVGQGLDIADILTVLLCSELNYQPIDAPPESDRLILSAGHYSIGLWAALAEAGHLDDVDLAGYALDGSDLIPSTLQGKPPMIELTGGSLGHGLGVAVGLCAGYRIHGWTGRIVNVMSDGEVQEGSTWEAAMLAGGLRLGKLFCVIDVNRTQADGDLVLEIEPLADKWRAFGWWCVECDGNDIDELLAAFEQASSAGDQPKAIVCHTRLGRGVRLIEERDRNHFVRVAEHEWAEVAQQLEVDR